MYRVLDVERAFAHLPAADAPFTLRLEVEDAFYPATNGTWTFRFGPHGPPRRADGGALPDATLRIGIADLSSLVVGSLDLPRAGAPSPRDGRTGFRAAACRARRSRWSSARSATRASEGFLKLTIQLCTYNRAHLLGRVLEACFDQTLAPDRYEVVLVNDGSRDDTPAVIERARRIATCTFTVIDQANAGLAKARNAGIARATGERIAFIDDDVLPTPVFAAEHLRSDERHGDVVVRGAVINTESFDALPLPVWSLAELQRELVLDVQRRACGGPGWTPSAAASTSRSPSTAGRTSSSGLRLRALGTQAVFNRRAVAFHWKPAPKGTNVAGMLRQVRAQARTAVRLEARHPGWRVALAIGDTRRSACSATRCARAAFRPASNASSARPAAAAQPATRPARVPRATRSSRRPARRGALLASAAYYDELARAKAER